MGAVPFLLVASGFIAFALAMKKLSPSQPNDNPNPPSQ